MMEGHHNPLFLFLLLATLLLFFLSDDDIVLLSHSQLLQVVDNRGPVQIYVVDVVRPEGANELLGDEELESWHRSFLPNTTLDSGEPRLVYSYRHVLSGFAARLTREEAEAMEAMDGFLHAEPDREYELETTYSPSYLGLNQTVDRNGTWKKYNMGEGMVIGVIDTGIPGIPHPSFGDKGMLTKPPKWKGTCDSKVFSPCNNKVIGALLFNSSKSYNPIDIKGHGTHVAGIAAGNFVQDAHFQGWAKGVASGMAPRAHLAIYKVCNPNCTNSDVLKAVDQAITDGVDVINMSLGGSATAKFYNDATARGTLAAVRHNISVVTSAGNYGPKDSNLTSSAPWVMVVGASTLDRRNGASVKLGNGMQFEASDSHPPLNSTNYTLSLPLVFAGINESFCTNMSLAKIDVKGKAVLCYIGGSNNVTEKGKVVKGAGGSTMILVNRKGYTGYSSGHVLPVCRVSYGVGDTIVTYIQGSKKSTPTATIDFAVTRFGSRPAPTVGSFSSRGPSLTNGGILKPDVLAPGENILSAWPNPPASAFNFDTGTSMASPHVAGIIALIKKRHPDWSPAAIQSAIITSASDLDLDGKPIVDQKDNKPAGIFATGAGQVNASGAMDPGLVYDILNHDDYVGYLCGLGYNDSEVTWTVGGGRRIQCAQFKKIEAWELNYPSITVYLGSNSTITRSINRTVKNVGPDKSTYTPRIVEPAGVKVKLLNKTLQFSKKGETKKYTVEISINSTASPAPKPKTFGRGKLQWVSSAHVVTTPIAVIFT